MKSSRDVNRLAHNRSYVSEGNFSEANVAFDLVMEMARKIDENFYGSFFARDKTVNGETLKHLN